MKVVLFCGGLGMRLRDFSDKIPKPMVTIGYRPVLWHVMKYYAAHGHKDFVLCLGYKADVIKRYFVDYAEYTMLRKGGAALGTGDVEFDVALGHPSTSACGGELTGPFNLPGLQMW